MKIFNIYCFQCGWNKKRRRKMLKAYKKIGKCKGCLICGKLVRKGYEKEHFYDHLTIGELLGKEEIDVEKIRVRYLQNLKWEFLRKESIENLKHLGVRVNDGVL